MMTFDKSAQIRQKCSGPKSSKWMTIACQTYHTPHY